MKIFKHVSVCLLALGFCTMSVTIVQAQLKFNSVDDSDAPSLILNPPKIAQGMRWEPSKFMLGNLNCSSFSLQNGTEAVNSLGDSVENIGLFSTKTIGPFSTPDSCKEAMKPRTFSIIDRFTTERCNSSYLCSLTRVGSISDQTNQNKFNVLIREIAAKDLARNLIKMKSADMEELEILKNFAQKKYGDKIGASCAARFGGAGESSCNLPILEKAFKENQTSCTQGFGCYNTDSQGKEKYSYKTFEEKLDKNSNQSPMISFFESRVAWKTNKHLEQDKAYLEDLGTLVSSASYIKASVSVKEDMFIKHIKLEGSRSRYTDPVLSYDFGIDKNDISKIKEKPQFKNLKAILHKKNISKKDFIAEFESFRKKRSETLLGDKEGECSSTPSVASICDEVTNLNLGLKNIMSSVTLASILENHTLDKESDEFKKLNLLLGNSINSVDEMEVFLDAERCTSFDYVDLNYNKSIWGTRGNPSNAPYGDDFWLRNSSDGELYNGAGTIVKDRSPSSSTDNGPGAMNDTLTSLDLGKTNGAAVKELDSDLIEKAAVKPAEQGAQNSNDSYNANNYFNQNPLVNTQFNPKDSSDYLDRIDKENNAIQSAEVAGGISDTSADNSKLEELMKKLSATEEKLDKLKETTDAAEESRVKEKKMQEENALIAELKGQISELKSKSSKAVVSPRESQVASVAKAPAASSTPDNFVVSSNRPVEAKATQQENVDAQRTTADAAGSASSSDPTAAVSGVGRSIASTQLLTAVNAARDSGNTLTLTKMDGLTPAAAAEAISSRILELNGVPFLIEEDGVTKKIIPLLKDGKIDMDENGQPRYVKMKVNKRECSDEEKARGACRVPASAVAKANTTVADEKRDQEVKIKREIERAQYLKLKALTNKALHAK